MVRGIADDLIFLPTSFIFRWYMLLLPSQCLYTKFIKGEVSKVINTNFCQKNFQRTLQ